MGNYFATLHSMWEELDHYETGKPICPADAVAYKDKMEINRIFEFLARLNEEFELACVNILSRCTLPSLNEVYALAQSEKSKKNVIHQYSSGTLERSALTSIPVFQKGGKNVFKKEKTPWKGGPIDKDKLCCSHCGKMRHIKDNCWDLITDLKNSASLEICEQTQSHLKTRI